MALCEIDNPAYEIYIREDGRWDYRPNWEISDERADYLAAWLLGEIEHGKHSEGVGEGAERIAGGSEGCEGV
jgi:hypothetical protein